jgi:hypothetical protein
LLATLVNLPEPGSVLRRWISSAWGRIDLPGQAAAWQAANKQARKHRIQDNNPHTRCV